MNHTPESIRADFERHFSGDGVWLKAIEREGFGYKLMQAHTAWVTWQAAAALYANQTEGGAK